MKKKLACLVLLTGLAAAPAQAGVFGTADTLRNGQFVLGLEPSLAFSPAQFLLYIHGGYGLTPGIDLDAKLGIGSYTYFGADVEFNLVPDTKRTPAVSLSAGAHGSTNFGLDTTFTVSKWFKTFCLFGALDADFEVLSNQVLVPLYLDLGVAIPLGRRMDFVFEANIGLTTPSNSGISGGVDFYF